ncbi:MAG: TatD family hydrolase [Candidatus Pacebacteria bacterium]|nr:TatD family hydrolase [Candidatus Paceibacterota bacterium]
MVDTHAHLNFRDFDKDRNQIIKECRENGIFAINVGSDYESSKKAVEIAEKENGFYAAVGLHPSNIETKLIKQPDHDFLEKFFDSAKYETLAKSPKVKAIGETGIDLWRRPKSKEKRILFEKEQESFFLPQLELAKKLNLPLIIHCRIAFEEMFKVLAGAGVTGTAHCFTGTWEQAQKFLDMGFYLGFTGIIFKMDLIEVIKKCPMDRMLLETDCPYLSPPDFGEQRNTPLSLPVIAAKIASIKNLTAEEIISRSSENAQKLFKLDF